MTIGIVGTRSRDTLKDYEIVRNKLLEIMSKGDRICSGKCSLGADQFAVVLTEEFESDLLEPLWFPANWNKYGKSAGFMRNTDIARESDILIACVSKDRKGGTEDTIKKFIKFHGKDQLYIV